ncbi:MAG: MraY family glycosyltransferase [Limisphaerales bacterium]
MLTFPFNLYLPALVLPAVLAFGLLPWWCRWCERRDLVDEPGHRKDHGRVTPLAGGLAVCSALALTALAGAAAVWWRTGDGALAFTLGHGLNRRAVELGAILFGALALTALGVLDDRHELKPLPKFAGQLAVALLVAAAGVRVTLFVDSPLFSYAVTVLWLLTLINAFNFMDNMNGLCAGLGAIAAGAFAAIAALHGQYLVTTFALMVVGALLGFLPHNFPRARAFLGDAGSHLVGYLVAVLAVLPHFHTPQNPRPLAVLTPLLVLAVPLADLVMVVVIRTANRRPFWVGDTNHLSHRLVRRGLSKTTAVLVIWLLAALSATVAVWANR